MERNTIQKQVIYSALCHLANHPTADDVFETVHEAHPNISRATVYRVLNQMAEKGTVLKVNINNGADRFDHQTFRHDHIRCERCGRVSDVDIGLMTDPVLTLKNASGYKVTGYSLQFDGICPECIRKEDDSYGQ